MLKLCSYPWQDNVIIRVLLDCSDIETYGGIEVFRGPRYNIERYYDHGERYRAKLDGRTTLYERYSTMGAWTFDVPIDGKLPLYDEPDVSSARYNDRVSLYCHMTRGKPDFFHLPTYQLVRRKNDTLYYAKKIGSEI